MMAAIVLAAGLSRRMGRPKLLEDVGDRPLIRHTVEGVLGTPGVGDAVVVIGPAQREAFASALHGLPVRLAVNPRPEAGQASSLRTGVEALPPGAATAVVFLGDQPAVPADLVPRLVRALEDSGADIAVPSYRDGRGNPVLFRARVFPELLALTGDQGARALIERDRARVAVVAVDQSMPADVDTPEDLAALRARGGSNPGVD